MIKELYNLKTGKVFKTDLHQIEAYQHLMDNPRAALFLGMSLSKTVIALSYLYEMHYREAAIGKTLVIAPDKVARITWSEEINTWAHLQEMRYSLVIGNEQQRKEALNIDAEIYIIGVNNVGWLIDQYLYQKISRISGAPYGPWLGELPFDSLVIDELSLFKSRESGRFKKLRRALKVSKTNYRIGMTGTPSPNGYIDLWSQICLLDDGERLEDTFGKYLDKYFTTRGNGMIIYEYIPRKEACNIIAHKIQDIALTMNTRDKIKLPDLYVEDITIEMNDYDRGIYEALEQEYVLEFLQKEITVKNAADLTNKLLQISSGAIYDENKDWFEVNTVKLDALDKYLKIIKGQTTICVYQFRHELERIKKRFPFARELKTIHDFKDWNAGKIQLLLIHPASAGHGLNLQFGGSHMIWFSLTWNLEHYQQTIARLLRRGIIKDVVVKRLIVEGTRDKIVADRLNSKETSQEFLLKEIKALRVKYLEKL